MEIRLCGRLTVEHDGESLDGKLQGPQGQLLLAYLALSAGRGASRDELIDAVWHERPPADPGAALSTLLSRLRAALPEGVIEGRRELSLRIAAGDHLDVANAQAALEQARAAAARQDWEAAEGSARTVLETTRAPLLPGHDAPWLEEWRRRLDDLVVEALEVCAAAAVRGERGDLAAGEAAARELVEREPYRESGYQGLMEVQAARGNPAEALRVYEELRMRLRDELGTAPGPGVQAFHQKLLQGKALVSGGDSRSPGGSATKREEASADCRTPLPALIARLGGQRLRGRQSELGLLAASWEEVVESQQHRILFLVGEPGVGKTSLGAHFACEVYAGGATVLYGRAEPEALIPYQPFVEALRDLALNGPLGMLTAAALDVAELSRLVPEFRRRVPDLPPPSEESGGDDRYRLFSSAAALLCKATHDAPVLLLLDDLHWADQSSLRLLRHIARYSEPAPLLVLGTYRDTDLHRSAALPEALADLRREHLDQRIRLAGLNEEAVGELIADVTGAAPRGLPEVLHQETRGNPFFLVEMLRDLADAGALRADAEASDAAELIAGIGVPEGVREVIERRLAGLSEGANEALMHASLLGQEFELDVLAAVAGSGVSELDGPLEEALDAGLLTETEGGAARLGFSHALIRDTLYRRPSAMRRAQLHGQAGEALEALFAGDLEARAAELARHFIAAGSRGDTGKSIRYSVAAAEQATARLAHEEAAGHYGHALDLAKAAPALKQGLDEEWSCDLLLSLGEARWRAGELANAREACLEAADLAERLGDAERLARAALSFGGPLRFEVAAAVTRPVADLLQKALAALGDEDSSLRARLMGRLAAALAYSHVDQRRPSLAHEAVEIARRVGDRAALADVLASSYWATRTPDNVDRCLRDTRELAGLAVELGDRWLEAMAHNLISGDLLELGDIEASEREVAALDRLAEALRERYPRWLVAAIRGRRAHLDGRLEECEQLAHEALALGLEGQDENAAHAFGAQMLMVRREQGRLDELVQAVEGFTGKYPELIAWRCGLAWIYTELERETEARRELETLAANDFADIPRDTFWLLCMCDLAQVAAFLSDARRAELLYDLLRGFADRCMVVSAVQCRGSVSRLLGLLATTTSGYDQAAHHFEDALELNARIKSPLWVAHTQHEYARMLLLRADPGDREKSIGLLGEARDVAMELGLKALSERVGPLKLDAEAARPV